MKNKSVQKLTATALCVALGLLLPQLFHALGAGTVFLPMHIPVLLCGFICGAPYGALCGLITPLLSSMITGMPPLFPIAAAMMLELCAYGALTGFFYGKKLNVYLSLALAMLGGRVVSGFANALFMGMAGKAYGLQAFLSASFVTALPGIVLQIAVVPLLVLALSKAHLIVQRRG